MLPLIIAIWGSWIFVAIVNHIWKGGNLRSVGLGLIVLPLACRLVEPLSPWFVIGSMLVGIAILVLESRWRSQSSED